VKIAVTADNNDLDASIHPRFGRASHFIIYDTENEDFTALDNRQQLDAPQGAGIQAADTVIRSGANALILRHCGPKAFRVLDAANLAVYNTRANTVREALELFREKKLERARSADMEAHG
jgi:predicted Fe-Mo cluster-binding NifX family protein